MDLPVQRVVTGAMETTEPPGHVVPLALLPRCLVPPVQQESQSPAPQDQPVLSEPQELQGLSDLSVQSVPPENPSWDHQGSRESKGSLVRKVRKVRSVQPVLQVGCPAQQVSAQDNSLSTHQVVRSPCTPASLKEITQWP